MLNWETANTAWMNLLGRVEIARQELHCSVSNAWFRGMTNADWDLTPSILRIEDKIDADSSRQIKVCEQKIKELNDSRAKGLAKLKQLHSLLKQVHEQGDEAQERFISTEFNAVQQKLRTNKSDIDRIEHEISVIKALHYGERDAFSDWAIRSTRKYESSWEALAEMRHYGVPTRLLDWTEVLAVAIYFAIEDYFTELDLHWNAKDAKLDGQTELPFFIPEGLAEPSVWILNPYFLSRLARGENVILNPTLDPRYDYFQSFFVNRNWGYEYPIPMYSLWRDSRIAAQQGMFTCHGIERASLNSQLCKHPGILTKIVIEPQAAVYGVKHLKTFLNMDHFGLFRDLDSLGNRVKQRFIMPGKLVK